MSYLSLHQVGKSFGGLRALNNVSFEVQKGQILGIMGANGAGKTTLFGVIAGHTQPSTGDIRFNNQSIVGLRPDQVCRRGIARTFQIVKPFPNLTVMDNLLTAAMFGAAAIHDRRAALDFCGTVLDELGMASLAETPAHALTLSKQKKLEFARAVCTGGQVILLDEVMAGLTPTEVAEMLEMVRQMHQSRGLTILIIEHVMRALMQLSDSIVVLHHGELIASGTPQDIAVNARVHEVYFGESA
jgi:branched-chain amino acid transport system ATP-binding protein